MKPQNIEFVSSSEEQTQAFAENFAKQLQPGHCLTLEGNLGAGKTVFTRGICRGLGFQGGVHSPSYALVHEYPNEPPIYHLDLYRLPEGADFEEIGVEYYSFGDGITLIEWPQRLASLDVGISHAIKISHLSESERKIEIIFTNE
jgi:tRNA threonylcarbamoyladenosine biosynthesis protein TsaE